MDLRSIVSHAQRPKWLSVPLANALPTPRLPAALAANELTRRRRPLRALAPCGVLPWCGQR